VSCSLLYCRDTVVTYANALWVDPGWYRSVAVFLAARSGNIALVGIANEGLDVT
jgi:hypothetical protein